jgi:hypothetical protein
MAIYIFRYVFDQQKNLEKSKLINLLIKLAIPKLIGNLRPKLFTSLSMILKFVLLINGVKRIHFCKTKSRIRTIYT